MSALPQRITRAKNLGGDLSPAHRSTEVLHVSPVMATPAAVGAGAAVVGSAAIGYFVEEAGDS